MRERDVRESCLGLVDGGSSALDGAWAASAKLGPIDVHAFVSHDPIEDLCPDTLLEDDPTAPPVPREEPEALLAAYLRDMQTPLEVGAALMRRPGRRIQAETSGE